MEDTQILDDEMTEALPKATNNSPAAQFAAVMDSDHWLKKFMVNMLAAHQCGTGIDFKTAEMLLKQERDNYEAEVAIAMRIFRIYPHLFQHDKASASAAA